MFFILDLISISYHPFSSFMGTISRVPSKFGIVVYFMFDGFIQFFDDSQVI